MNIERDIALGSSCDIDQQILVDNMPLLEVESIANFISFGSINESYEELAQHIIDNRYTYYGWKNYMYCYINSTDSGLNCVIDNICIYSRNTSDSHTSSILSLFKLLYSPVLLVTLDSSERYVWKYFNDRVWMQIDKLQIKSMLHARIQTSNLLQKLTISPESSRILEGVYNKLMRGDMNSYMFSQSFEQDSDNKETNFCMNMCTYDINRNILRRPLPGDICTLSGDIDPDALSWNNNRLDMMNVSSTWMGGDDVADSYLNILSGALSEFGPRYAVINSGTGADGKSTFFHIISKLFGSYCLTTPGTGPSIDTKSSNDATPVATAMISKRVYITTDASNIWKLIASPGFKSMTGGDQSYIRRLYREASNNSPRLKALVLINTNQTDFVATSINELTRIRIVKWSSKRITEEDRDIIPKHQSRDSHNVIHKFENVFIKQYGSCMMMELIGRHMELKRRGMIIDVCPKIRQWTRDMVAPKTILRFMHTCTIRSDNIQNTIDYSNTSVDDATSYALSTQQPQQDASVEDLFMSYVAWRKTGARFSTTDPTTMDMFKTHLEFYHPISKRMAKDGTEELYVKGLSLKPDTDFLNILYPQVKSSNKFMQMLIGHDTSQTSMAPSITYG